MTKVFIRVFVLIKYITLCRIITFSNGVKGSPTRVNLCAKLAPPESELDKPGIVLFFDLLTAVHYTALYKVARRCGYR